jgi:hypothetical protein
MTLSSRLYDLQSRIEKIREVVMSEIEKRWSWFRSKAERWAEGQEWG